MLTAARTVMAGLMLSGAVAFAACGDDAKNSATPSAATPGASATAAAGDAGELRNIVGKFKDATFHVVLAATGAPGELPIGGIPSSVAISDISVFKERQDKLRFEIHGTRDGEPFYLALIQIGVKSYRCFPGEPATATADSRGGVCVDASAYPTNPVGAVSKTFDNLGSDSIEVQGTSKRTIAGEEATCYKTLDKSTSEVNTACFASDGVPLALALFEARSIARTVNAADFDLPYGIVPG
jgi:hypothetical protein